MRFRRENPNRAWTKVLVAGLLVVGSAVLAGQGAYSPPAQDKAAVEVLAKEVHLKGWIVFAARSEAGDWDIFLSRPDGTDRKNLTRTPNFNESSPLLSRDARKLLYRRLTRDENIDNNRHGEQGELVVANSDGMAPQVLGKPGELSWASWNPEGTQIASLSIKGIAFIDLATRQVLRTMPRKGFFQQMTWSPDGRWLLGVANSYGTGWSIARMETTTGATNAVNRVDCCTPDWFPDSKNVVFSWRPPGQKANNGYGWTQLWMADAEGKTRRLVYGEDGRHVYGGHVSPDGQYVLFTGNMEEDGDPGHAGAPMGLVRLRDTPIIGGESKELRGLHPQVHNGPVLALPAGWEPCWTFAEIGNAKSAEAGKASEASSNAPAGLAQEVHGKGWVVFSAKTERGDWDLFLMRPDGSERRKITDTPGFNEAGGRFSPDGRRLLYYRMPRTEPVDNNTYGTYELVMAEANGRNAIVYGNNFQWASWGAGGNQMAYLSVKAIQIVDLESRKVLREFPRRGIVQQLVWSPDGKSFVGTANGLGPFWNIGRVNSETGRINLVSEAERYNCTPDWMPDSQQVLYARGIIPQAGGRAELWIARADGSQKHMLYAEAGRHIYGGCASPDAKYLLFTRSVEDLGKVDNSRTTMALVRLQDTPMLGDQEATLQQRYPNAKAEMRLDLGAGWEPHWTYAEVTP